MKLIISVRSQKPSYAEVVTRENIKRRPYRTDLAIIRSIRHDRYLRFYRLPETLEVNKVSFCLVLRPKSANKSAR